MSKEGYHMKNFWMTGAVARDLSLSEDRVRQLERAGILKAIRTSSGVRLFDGAPSNIGMLLGAASAGLIDIDLDCPDAVVLAARFLPPTSCIFGRESTGATHWGYRLSPSMPTIKFTDVEKGADGASVDSAPSCCCG